MNKPGSFHKASIEKLADLFLDKRVKPEDLSINERREVHDVVLRRAIALEKMTLRLKVA